MNRINFVLLVLLLGSCVLLVRTAYESRRVYSALDRAQLQQRQLDAEYRRLDAEAKAQGTLLLVERSARERLHMRSATPAVTAYVVDPGVNGNEGGNASGEAGGEASAADSGKPGAAINEIASATGHAGAGPVRTGMKP